MIIITHYREERDEDGVIYIRSEEESVCPVCFGILKVIGIRRRYLINSIDEKETLIIRRMRCQTQSCQKIHHELPDRIIPYKRHCAETVEKVINGNVEDVCCDFTTESRIRAWWNTFRQYFENVLTSLQAKYGTAFLVNLTPKGMIRAIANTNLWVHTRSVSLST
jgi:hypothetical protein